MIPSELQEPPLRNRPPCGFNQRLRRKREQVTGNIRNLTWDYPSRLKIYAFIAITLDFCVSVGGLNLLQRIHLDADFHDNPWQHAFPTLVLSAFYLIPFVGIAKRSHMVLLIYVSITFIYLFFTFMSTARYTLKFHYAHYFYRSHYCPSRYVTIDSLISLIGILKMPLLWPVFRYYMHSRDRVEYDYYIRRELDNTYGLVELNIERNESSQETETTELGALELSQVFVDSLSKSVYENFEVYLSSPDSTFTTSTSDKDGISIKREDQNLLNGEYEDEETCSIRRLQKSGFYI